MKFIKLLVIMLLFSSGSWAQADGNITFSVDLSNYGGTFTEVDVNGSWNGWCGNCNPLTDMGGGIWETTILIPGGFHEFKYTIDGWTDQEFFAGGEPCTLTTGVNTNRTLDVDGDATYALSCFNSCCLCADVEGCTDMGAANYDATATCDNGSCTYNVTFQVDMSQYGAAFGFVNVSGAYNGWCGDCNQLSDPDMDNIYELTLPIPGGNQEFKFTVDNWAFQEEFVGGESCTLTTGGFTNRLINVSATETFGPYCWNSCDACVPAASDVRVTFVDTDNGELTLTNLGNASQDVSGWDVCNFPAYDDISALSIVSGDLVLDPAESVVLSWASIMSADAELGIYLSGPYSNSANIIDYVEWGSTGHTRSSVAVAAGVWNTGDFVSGASPYEFIGASGEYGSAFWQNYVAPVFHDVTFQVDMSNETIDAAGVHIAGSFQGWDAGSTPMTDMGGGIYAYTASLEEGTSQEYTFINGNTFGGQESVPMECGVDNGFGAYNREHTVGTMAETLDVVCFSSCDACLTGVGCTNPTAANYDAAALTDDGSCLWVISFQLDMNEYDMGTPGIVNVSGDWNGFCADCNQLFDADMDGVWTGDILLGPGSYVYKYQVDSWTDQEDLDPAGSCNITNFGFTNRGLTTSEADQTLDLVCWDSCYACAMGETAGCMDSDASNYDAAATVNDGSCLYNITFQVNMAGYAGTYGAVNVNGTFNGWCGDCNPMSDADMDGVYDLTIEIQEGFYEYKFTVDGWTDQEFLTSGSSCTVDNFGNVNRFVQLTAQNTVQPVACWALCDDCVEGCTDATAANYDASAVLDDGSCQWIVSFELDMNEYDMGTPGIVNVSGDWNGFCADCNQLFDADMDGVWTGDVLLGPGSYIYKFQVDSWTDQEELDPAGSCNITNGGFTNRSLEVGMADQSQGLVCWDSCYACAMGETPGCTDSDASNYDAAATVNDGSCLYFITFQVDMAGYGGTYSMVNVNGTFNGWCGDCNPMSDADMDGVYDLTIEIPEGYYEYKFTVDGWTDQEALTSGTPCTVDNFGFVNRFVQLDMNNLVQPIVCWNSCEACIDTSVPGCTDANALNYNPLADTPDGSCQYNMTFSVDMNQYVGAFGTVYISGLFNGWSGNSNPMDDADMDGVWDVTVVMTEGDQEYKFTIDDWTDQEMFVGGESCTLTTDGFTNRLVNVSANTSVPAVCWNSCEACPPSQIDVTFRVDMSNQTVDMAGVHIAGSFQGWDPGSTPMTYLGFGIYEIVITLDANSTFPFKYINGNVFGNDETVPMECGVDNGEGGYNRELTTGTSDMMLDVVCFNECAACAGCTSPFYVEYNPFAGSDDGSCMTMTMEGCTYPDATNYNASANVDDGSCMFDTANPCPADLTGDGVINAADLLEFLSAFGSTCE